MIELSDIQLKILSTLQAFWRPTSFILIARLGQLSEAQVEEGVRPLVDRGWLEEHAARLQIGPEMPDAILQALPRSNTKKRLDEILELVKSSQDVFPDADMLAIIDLLFRTDEIDRTFLLTSEVIRSGIKAKRYEYALELAAMACSRIQLVAGSTELGVVPIDMVLAFSSLAHACRKYFSETADALASVTGLCRTLGDERRLALVLLNLGLFYVFLHKMQECFDYFRQGFDIVERLGDADIKDQAAPFYSYYYSIQGLSQKALAHFEQSGHWEYSRNEFVPDPQLAGTFGIQAALTGQFHRAIGAMSAHWKRAIINGDHKSASFYRAFLGQVLLLSGQMDEAILHLNAAIETANVYDDAFTQIWAERAKAYYLFRLGRGRDSYEMLHGALEKSFRQGWSRPYYAQPWVIELLYYFHQNGYPPIHGYEFQGEMGKALAGPNIQLRGTAYRIQAKIASEKGEAPDVVRDLLMKSESDHIVSGNPFELAKTRAQIAILYKREGILDKAREFALQAWEGLCSGEGQAMPPEIKSLLGDAALPAPARSSDRDVMVRFMDMMEAWAPSASLDEVAHQILLAITHFFHAERGAIFLIQGGPGKQIPVFYKGCNLTPEDMGDKQVQNYLRKAIAGIPGDSPIIIREPVSDGALPMLGIKSILCIPFSIGNGEYGLLYYDTIRRSNAFQWSDSVMLTRIIKSIRTELHRIWEYSRLIQQARLVFPAVTELPAQDSSFFITSSELFRKTLRRAELAGMSNAPVLILGETGSGKEMIAKRIHATSPRRNMPFIAINLASIPETLLESELFGHEKGAFTGADRQKLGRMELADKGTLFIDEVGDIPKSVQVKLLRALEEMSIVRIGGTIQRKVDCRLIAATNRVLTDEVEAGNFRSDLYYRLNVIPIFTPPLRQRGDDIIELAQKFLEQAAKKYNKPVQLLSPQAKDTIKEYKWPGNVRELRNMMERAVALNTEPGRLSDIMIDMLPHSRNGSDLFADRPTLDEVQRRYISLILKDESSMTNAAMALGMKRTSLYRRLKSLGMDKDSIR